MNNELQKQISNRIKKLIQQGEHEQLDFKYCINDSKKIARSMVAFANTNGGTLLIGVKDNGVIVGVRSEEEYYMLQGAAELYCKPAIQYTFNEWLVDGKTVVELNVAKSEHILHRAPDEKGNWKIYIRVKDNNFLANRIYLKVYKRKKQNKGVLIRYSDIEKKLFDYLNQHNKITFTKYYKLTNLPYYKAESILIDLIVLDIIKMEFSEHGVIYKLY